MRKERRDIYITSDNKEFINKDDANKHEKKLKRKVVFLVKYAPDLNETGRYTSVGQLIIEASGRHMLFAKEWCFEQYGIKLKYIQGHEHSNSAVEPFSIKKIATLDDDISILASLKID